MIAAIACLHLLNPSLDDTWTGEMVFRIWGKGRVEGTKPSWGEWNIDREVRGTITFDRKFKGAGIARTPDSRNETRYETWVSDARLPIRMKANDTTIIYAPLHSPTNIRHDITVVQVPPKGTTTEDRWMIGKAELPILQIDHQSGTYIYESPRIYTKGYKQFTRKFVKGSKDWVSHAPLLQEEFPIEYEVRFDLAQPTEWFRLSGKFAPGQKEISLSRSFSFSPVLGASFPDQKLKAELKLVLRRSP